MNIYIWERLDRLTEHWHSEGGLVVIAGSMERVYELVGKDVVIDKSPDHILFTNAANEKVITFPDAGCC